MHPLLMRKRGYRMTFAAGLPSSVVAGLGTVGVAGGAMRATGIAANGYNLATNPEFTTNTTGWDAFDGATLTRRDFAASPDIDPTGGADNYGLEVKTAGNANARAQNSQTGFAGATYSIAARAYAPSSNGAVNAAYISTTSGLGVQQAQVSSEDAWKALAFAPLVATAAFAIRLWPKSTTLNDVAYYDNLSCYRHNAIAWFPAVGVNLQLPVALAMPAAPNVTPIDLLVRGADALNYWAVRLMPNTAGNDCQIIEVVNGVETVRAAADVDWTAGGTDYVLLDVRGPALTVYAMKQGASVWSPAASYATMATQLTSPGIGVQYFGTTTGPTLVDWAPRAL